MSCDFDPGDIEPTVFLAWPGPGGDITENVERARRMADACVRAGGPLIRHITTRNEARDIDRIRRALGESRLSYWGTSYGTYVGVEDRFPDFAAWAAARHRDLGLGATPEVVRDTYLRLTAELDLHPRPDLTGNTLRAVMFNSLYADAAFPLLAAFLRAANTGTPAPPLPSTPPDFANLLAVQNATACNDVAWPGPDHDYAGDVARDRAAYPLTGGMPANIRPCAFWPYRPAEPATRVSQDGPRNILMIQNRRDPATPLAGALKLKQAFGPRARMVVVSSGGHNAYLANGNACGDQAVTAFLTDGTRPDQPIVTC